MTSSAFSVQPARDWSDVLLRALIYAGVAAVAFEYLLIPLALLGVIP